MNKSPMNHQIEGEALANEREGFAWFMETGTGKTYTGILNIARLYRENKIRGVIIIAPKNVYREVWEAELREFMPKDIKFHVAYYTSGMTFNEENVMNVLIKNTFLGDSLKILLINVESFSTKHAVPICLTMINNYKTMVIVDESTFIKNPKANRTKHVLMVSPFAAFRRVMSGYPVLNSPEDLYTQIRFLGPNFLPFDSFYAFRNFYCILKSLSNGASMVVSHRNLDHLADSLQKISYRKLKADCLDLPDKVYEKRFIEMTMEQKQLYNSMKNSAMIQFSKDETLVASNIMTLVGKLHQIANGVVYSPLGNKYIDNNKKTVLQEIIETELATKQVVIWVRYTENIKQLTTIFKEKYSNSTTESIYGDTGPKDRHIYLEKFQNGKLRYLITNPATLGHGIKLIPSHYSIYYNNDFSLEHRIQSEDRQHRAGQTNKVTYIDLITEGTVEKDVLKCLQEKMNVSATILKDQWRKWLS